MIIGWSSDFTNRTSLSKGVGAGRRFAHVQCTERIEKSSALYILYIDHTCLINRNMPRKILVRTAEIRKQIELWCCTSRIKAHPPVTRPFILPDEYILYWNAKETIHFCNENCGKFSELSTKIRQRYNRQDISLPNAQTFIDPNLCQQDVRTNIVILTKQIISWQCACANNSFYKGPRHHCLYINKMTQNFQSVFIQHCNLTLKISILNYIPLK